MAVCAQLRQDNEIKGHRAMSPGRSTDSDSERDFGKDRGSHKFPLYHHMRYRKSRYPRSRSRRLRRKGDCPSNSCRQRSSPSLSSHSWLQVQDCSQRQRSCWPLSSVSSKDRDHTRSNSSGCRAGQSRSHSSPYLAKAAGPRSPAHHSMGSRSRSWFRATLDREVVHHSRMSDYTLALGYIGLIHYKTVRITSSWWY